jgi:hypothetical protein
MRKETFGSNLIIAHISDGPIDESQRDSGTKPRVARNELPWLGENVSLNRNVVVANARFSHGAFGHDPVGVVCSVRPVPE